MSYEVIARKFRPQDFDSIVGQNHVTQTLRNSLRDNRLPHALLFTGPRGTGKTSSARVLAKTIRCENSQDFSPCNKCSSCIEITQGSCIDVIEIDGASNNGVDAIRELRDTVIYMPASGKYKIYIIDEVHMLSTSAFNALLKTLEEPPAHVVFIMATTEAHKIPQTILSRCQRFDFRKISTKQIAGLLAQICSLEKITADPKALWLIARQADGSMRDSQSLLDQVISFARGELTEAKVTEVLGLTDRALLNQTLDGLAQRNTSQILDVILRLSQVGVEPKLFCEEMIELFRHILLLKAAAGSDVNELIDLPDSEIAALVQISTFASEEDFHLLFDMMLKGLQDIARSASAHIVLEVVLLRMASAPRIVDLEELRLGEATALPRKESATPTVTASVRPATFLEAATPQDKWLLFVDTVRNKDGFFAAKIENLLFQGVENKKIRLAVPPKLAFLKEQMADVELRKKLQGLIDSLWGQGYSFEVSVAQANSAAESAQSLSQKKNLQAEDQIRTQIEQHPQVMAAKQVFKGMIKKVQNSAKNS